MRWKQVKFTVSYRETTISHIVVKENICFNNRYIRNFNESFIESTVQKFLATSRDSIHCIQSNCMF
jgi:hypothetical protein